MNANLIWRMSDYLVLPFPEAMQVVVSGDIHGDFNLLVNKLCLQYQLRDTLLIVAGDCGFGFNKLAYYEQMVQKNSRRMAEANNWIVFVRGNHDNPAYFDGKVFMKKRFMAVPDYTVIHAAGHRILCVGGAISIDRKSRMDQYEMKVRYNLSLKLNKDPLLPKFYWEKEKPVYHEELIDTICQKESVDVVVTHTAPSGCYPFLKGLVGEFAAYDPTLLSDTEKERETLHRLFERLLANGAPIGRWYYGHFHESKFSDLRGVLFKLLDIMEFDMLPPRGCGS